MDYAIAAADQAPPGMYPSQPPKRQVAVVRLYGVNEKGNSVCAFVHGFEAYFFVEKPPGWTRDHKDALAVTLNVS